MAPFNKGNRFGRRKVDPFLADKTLVIDYKNPELLRRFISDRGKIVPSRISGLCAKNQRKLSEAIKRARSIALVPFAKLESE
jgi:large subunit ribosomal protein L9